MSLFFDRKGKPLALFEWAHLFQDENYQTIELLEERRDDGTEIRISTVWIGVDAGFGAPNLFETMLFISGTNHPYDRLQWRWSTEEEAREGHRLIVEAYRENQDPRLIIEAWRKDKLREGMN